MSANSFILNPDDFNEKVIDLNRLGEWFNSLLSDKDKDEVKQKIEQMEKELDELKEKLKKYISTWDKRILIIVDLCSVLHYIAVFERTCQIIF